MPHSHFSVTGPVISFEERAEAAVGRRREQKRAYAQRRKARLREEARMATIAAIEAQMAESVRRRWAFERWRAEGLVRT